ncbi:MAG: hypothetical protein A2096_01555 [Spirochaetes bacterium GWF1_41_5]|nr:MAG: hypothetical protein A2096_01555 [Spirochaetes bacterium GWF1_41_5]
MKTIQYCGWKCAELASGNNRLLVTLEIGPRIIGAFCGDSENLFFVNPDYKGKKNGDIWVNYGGHRLWIAPESLPRCRCADNHPVDVIENNEFSEFIRGREESTGVFKSIIINPLPDGCFKLSHILRNDTLWPLDLSAWAITVMAPGGTAVMPLPASDPEGLLPNTFMAFWPYCRINDRRFYSDGNIVYIRQDKETVNFFKIGMQSPAGWIAYINNGFGFLKKSEFHTGSFYPDNGCNLECFTRSTMLEIETLGPLTRLQPGESLQHDENISFFPDIDAQSLAKKFGAWK